MIVMQLVQLVGCKMMQDFNKIKLHTWVYIFILTVKFHILFKVGSWGFCDCFSYVEIIVIVYNFLS